MKELRVSAIENGTVIDHIPPQSMLKVVKILGLGESKNMILFGTNLESSRLGRKGVIKVANKYFDPVDISKICLFAPQATVVTIKNYEVESKQIVEIPEEIKGIVKCPNTKCITNHENMESSFKIRVLANNDIKLKCSYCEKVANSEDIRVR